MVQHPEPSLQVFRFKDASDELVDIEEASFVCALRWPTLHVWAVPLAMSVRSDPAYGWQPHPDLEVPFHTSRTDRLFVVTLWVVEGANIYTLVLFVPFSTIFSQITKVEELGEDVRWDVWGPRGSRMMKAPNGHSMIWVCYIFGQSFIAPWHTPDHSTQPVGPKAIQILDFSQLAVKKDIAEGLDRDHPVTTVVQSPTTLNLGPILERPVKTYLPYRAKTIRVPTHENHTFNAVMMSEDSIVTVTSVCFSVCLCPLPSTLISSAFKNPNVRQYRILSF